MSQTATSQPNLRIALPVQINASLTWAEFLTLMQSFNQKIEIKIAPPDNTINGFNQETLQLLESNSLQDYLDQEEYIPPQKEINYYRNIVKR